MGKLESKMLQWVDRHMVLLVMIAASLAGAAVRWPLRGFISWDIEGYLLPWYDLIRADGLSEQVGNYNFLYQMAIWLFTKLPIKPIYAYKGLSVAFDYMLALSTAALTANLAKDNKMWKAVASYSAVLLMPTVVLNSAAWGQCDAIFCTFGILALLLLVREQYTGAMVLLGLSFSFKLQAVFFLPAFLFVYFRKRRFSVLKFLWVPGMMLATGLPMVFWGRNVFEIFQIYFEQTETYLYMALNYPSVWTLLCDPLNENAYLLLHKAAVIFTVVMLAALMLVWLRQNVKVEKENLIILAFLLCYTCVLFLPAMHERYGFPYEILAILLAVLMPKTWPLCGVLIGMSLCTYGYFLFGVRVFSLQTLTVANLLVYGGYLWYLNRRMTGSNVLQTTEDGN